MDSFFKEKRHNFINVELHIIFDISSGFYQECEKNCLSFYAFLMQTTVQSVSLSLTSSNILPHKIPGFYYDYNFPLFS